MYFTFYKIRKIENQLYFVIILSYHIWIIGLNFMLNIYELWTWGYEF